MRAARSSRYGTAVYPAYYPSLSLLEPGFPYGEDLLQFIWEARLFDHRSLRTVDGHDVDILSPGRIQKNSGPDLDGAVVRIREQLWAGTVEVHLRSSEWNTHGHQFDPAYDNVVLHVVHEHDAEVRTASGMRPPTLELKSRIKEDGMANYHRMMTSGSFVPCADQLKNADPLQVSLWLENLLRQRFDRKVERAQELHAWYEGEEAQLLYHLLLEGFGMRTNAGACGMLARSLPLRLLLKYRDDHFRLDALLLGTAGLLPQDDQHRMMRTEFALLSLMHSIPAIPAVAWKMGRIRPVNHPRSRLMQFRQLFVHLQGEFDRLLMFTDLDQVRKTFTAPALPLGRSAIDHLIINVVVPMLFFKGRTYGRPQLEQNAIELLEQLAPEKNDVLEGWARCGMKARSAAHGQALLELKELYCSRRLCLSCGIGKSLLKGSADRYRYDRIS